MSNGDKKPSSIERSVFWIGSLLSIAIAAFTLYSLLTKASPPDLDVALAIGGGTTMRIAPLVNDENSPRTEFFPIGVIVANHGEVTARDVILRWAHPENFVISSSNPDLAMERNTIISGPGQRFLSAIHLGDIHPNQERRLDDSIFAAAENTTRMHLQAMSSDNIPIHAVVAMTVTYEIEARVSAQDVSEKTVHFYITVGPKNQLEKLGQPYWEAETDGVTLQVPRKTVKSQRGTANPAAPSDQKAPLSGR